MNYDLLLLKATNNPTTKAVLKLHKPKKDWKYARFEGDQDKKIAYCSVCIDSMEDQYEYPCPTVEVIIKAFE